MFGDQLRRAREEAGLTQEQLADGARVHRTYVSLLERDKKSPTLDVMFRLAEVVGTPLSALIARIEAERLPPASKKS